MKRLLIFFGMMPFLGVGAAHADITHKLSSSVQLNVNAAATQVERIGSTYSVSGNNVTTQYTPTGGSATASIGSMTISSGVGAIPTLSATQATAGESWVLLSRSHKVMPYQVVHLLLDRLETFPVKSQQQQEQRVT